MHLHRGAMLATFMLGLTLGGLLSSNPRLGSPTLEAQAPAAQSQAAGAQRTVWYFYRVKWGSQGEFVELFKKNHYPILKSELQSGRLTALHAYVPTFHGDGRADWTFAVALTFRDASALMGPSGEEELARKLFPDQATFLREERRRFEVLDAHWDVPLNELDLDAK